MKSNPTRAGPSRYGSPYSNLVNGNETVLCSVEESARVRSQGRWATSGGEGAR